jgi:hypothetical protein
MTCQISGAPAESKSQANEKGNKPQTKERKTLSVLHDSESQVSAEWLWKHNSAHGVMHNTVLAAGNILLFISRAN